MRVRVLALYFFFAQVSGTPLLPAYRGEAAGHHGAENGGAPGELGG